MKKLETLSLTRLSNLEFGQHTKSIHANIIDGGESGATIHNTVLLQYLSELNLKNQAYDRAMVQIVKSDETVKIVKADELRDKAFTCIQRHLSVFEFSNDSQDLLAFASLNTLFNNYKALQRWNLEEETNGIDNLVVDLRNVKYSGWATAIGMTQFIDRLEESNNNFKLIFNGRTQEVAGKEVFDVKELRGDLKSTYEKMIHYVLAMATAADTDEFNRTLNVINTVRKYYSDLLARRKSPSETPTPSVN